MKLTEIGTRPAIANGSGLSFFVPPSWMSHNEIEYGASVFLQHRIGEELRYHLTPGPGRKVLLLRWRPPTSAILSLPMDAARDLGIVEGSVLELSMMGNGTLVVRRQDP